MPEPSYAVARTEAEALLYLDLQPCPDCGSTAADWSSGLAEEDGELVSAFDTECPGCGAGRSYLFGLPEQETAGAFPAFGGPEPSELLDAGQWLRIADAAAASAATEDQDAGALARAAIEEVVKFVPAGAGSVPDRAFWTPEGRAVHAAEPDRFRLERLLVVRDSYTDPGAA